MRLFKSILEKEFETLYKGNYSRLIYCAYEILMDEEEAKDVVNSVFSELWKNYSSFRKDNTVSFLFTSVRHRCIDIIRHRNIVYEYEQKYLRETEEGEEEKSSLYSEENIRRMEEALDSFTPQTQAIFRKCYFENKKYQEVAQELGISSSAVHKHIVQGFAKFRRIFLEGKE